MGTKQNKTLVKNANILRKTMTKEERRLWYTFLRNYPVRFYRQKILGRYIVDFYCAKANLVVELDGSQHYEEGTIKKDLERTSWLEGLGLTVLRFSNLQIHQEFDNVCNYIHLVVEQKLKV